MMTNNQTSDYNKSQLEELDRLVGGVRQKITDLIPNEIGIPKKITVKRWWTPREDEQLRKLVQQYGAKNWKRIASYLRDRTDVQCLHRWQKVLNPNLVKGPWTKNEDNIIIEMVKKYGPRNWSLLAQS